MICHNRQTAGDSQTQQSGTSDQPEHPSMITRHNALLSILGPLDASIYREHVSITTLSILNQEASLLLCSLSFIIASILRMDLLVRVACAQRFLSLHTSYHCLTPPGKLLHTYHLCYYFTRT